MYVDTYVLTSWHCALMTLMGTFFVSMAGWILTYTWRMGARGRSALDGIHLQGEEEEGEKREEKSV